MLRLGIILSPGFQMISLAAISAFEVANVAAHEPCYDITILSDEGGPVRRPPSARLSRPNVSLIPGNSTP